MKPTDLRGILQYVPEFRERVFVLSIDGAIISHENFSNLLLDIAVLRSLNIYVVIVHGASSQIRVLAQNQKVTLSDYYGSGITDKLTLDLALQAANRLTHDILEGLSLNDLRGAATNGIVAFPKGIIKGIDHKLTGKVERIENEFFHDLLQNGIIPVVPPFGFDGEGNTYRVNSDQVAMELSGSLKASKLIYLTCNDGLVHKGKLIRQIQVCELDQILNQSNDQFKDDGLTKAQFASQACHASVPRVHIINGLIDEGLLTEVFSNEGIGTLVYANEYQQIRQAMKKDVRNILTLTQKSVDEEELIKRSRAAIEQDLSDYYIFEVDKNPVACVALHFYPESQKGEIAYLCVSPTHENLGIGQRLIRFVEEKAKNNGLTELFLLSTQAFSYFQSKCGFKSGSIEILPDVRREKYEKSERNSRILFKSLNR